MDLASVEPSLAGPRRPQDRVPLARAKQSFAGALGDLQKGIKKSPSASSGGGTANTAIVRGCEAGGAGRTGGAASRLTRIAVRT